MKHLGREGGKSVEPEDEMLSFAHGVAVVLRTSLQLWLPAQDLGKIKPRAVLWPSRQH